MPRVAAKLPMMPRVRKPMKVAALIAIGPGVV